MSLSKNRVILSASVFAFVLLMLTMVQLKVETKMLLLERIFVGGGWLQILLLSSYGAFIIWFMQDIKKATKWRLITWTIFSIWFFLQLFLGIVVNDIFLLTGKLHLPIPAMILGGPIYRAQWSIMTLLFLSTIVLAGPSWCSHLCYFGAIDGLVSKKNKLKKKGITNIQKGIKIGIVLLIIFSALTLRLLGVNSLLSTVLGLSFGIVGLAVVLILSRRQGKMVHCAVFCPIGTVINYLGKISPFRLKINASCTNCMACIPSCKYNALDVTNIRNKKPGLTCTLCGDCLKSCHTSSFQYQFLGLKPAAARNLYLFITISLHAIFMGMGRI